MAPLPPEAWAAALATLPAMGPARLAALLGEFAPPDAFGRVVAQTAHLHPAVAASLAPRPADVARLWAAAARRTDAPEVWQRLRDAGVGVAALGSAAYPPALAADLEPPGVVFFDGHPDRIAGPRVAIVGTRRCTAYGREVAFELAHDLAEAGVGVVSGLALGIDGASHAGALAARGGPPLAVVGSGLDVIYPRRHASLWRGVAAAGVVLSEAPLGAPPERWRFPARNRLIAALADVVVVVESHVAGGSMLTVSEAHRRQRPVLAVPGPVRSPASLGTNRLIADGAAPACDATDVLVALGLSPGGTRSAADRRPSPSTSDAAVLDTVGWQPSTLEQVVLRAGLPLADVALALARLEADGWLAQRGGWYERAALGDHS